MRYLRNSISLWTILLVTAPVAGFVCLLPTTPKTRLSHRILSRGTESSKDNSLICWQDTALFESTSNTSLLLERSKNSDHNKELLGGRLRVGGFLERLRDWSQTLRLSPRFRALIKQKTSSSDHPPTRNSVAASQGVEIAPESPIPAMGMRSAVSSKDTDLSGKWRPIATPHFREAYDAYLVNCSQSFLFRKVLVNGVTLQLENIRQKDKGRSLEICASTPAGSWNRTLVASGTAQDQDVYEALNVTIRDPDGDLVQVEAWWEDEGKVHRSWLRGKKRLDGGQLETARYLEGEDVLICESTFHPNPGVPKSKNFQPAHVVWRYQRED